MDPHVKATEEQRGGALDPVCPIAESENYLEAEIDRDVDESFPASDPPGWVLGIEAGYTLHDEEDTVPVEQAPSARASAESVP